MRIGELTRRTGVSIRLLRYYEEQDLLHPERSSSGYREYVEADVTRVRRIQALLAAGMGTRRIARLLPCLVQHEDGLRLSCADLYGVLVAERNSLLDRIASLNASVTALTAIIEASPAGPPPAHGR
ncbi:MULTISPECIES: MerR family transcriptional regulator [unclassified Methylobacterium]|jgi:DNA-binding transcriptional MerR regulator|uniref:MerR family transcriptional regulator n=1 Tax=unclassified Methylobacterium TaxID=2615210 RepID=UPI00135564A5|nr:MerR family transcriptional regulator [Methylobacterium sp. 2A]MWV25500.1 MerR family transcriptional regulator [Methylobacterium sp. 2A]